MKRKDKLVSVIINTKNEEKDIENLLESINSQSYCSFEIILVDNNSKDKTKAIAKKYTSKVFNKGPERSAQRNYGVQKSEGEYLLFVDADMVITKTLISDCVMIMNKDSRIGGIIIPEESKGEGFWAKVKAFERSFYVGDERIESARFYRRSVFKNVGGFDEELVGFEDLELSNRVRSISKIARTDKKIIHNEGKLTLLGMARKSAYYARTSGKLLQKWNKSPFNPQTFYFLRGTYYRNWRKILSNPQLSAGMVVMLTTQLIFGGFSYLKNK